MSVEEVGDRERAPEAPLLHEGARVLREVCVLAQPVSGPASVARGLWRKFLVDCVQLKTVRIWVKLLVQPNPQEGSQGEAKRVLARASRAGVTW